MLQNAVPSVARLLKTTQGIRIGAKRGYASIEIGECFPHPPLEAALNHLVTVRAVEQLRRDRRTVLIHYVRAHSRTPTVAALYVARRQGVKIADALSDLRRVLPNAYPNAEFLAALQRLHPDGR
jgi:hypothetical protein